MTDFNAILTPGELPDYVNTVIEIPKGSMLKVEYRRELGIFELDRVEPAIFAKPANYGFIPQTLDDDGDELDTLVVCDEPLPTGIVVRASVIGLLNFEDDGEMDHKVICVPLDERNTGNAIKSLDDLPRQWQNQIEHHFSHYKDLKKPGTTKVLGWGDVNAAHNEIKRAIKAYQEVVK
jgi:inorganic pyrophosphatase